jgi:hypothetical protein
MLLYFLYGIIKGMAISLKRPGRPCLVAVINFSGDPDYPFWDEFYKVCSSFHYAEIMALSRAFGLSPRTVENWKYRISFPRNGIAQQVVAWVEQGKPMKKVLLS